MRALAAACGEAGMPLMLAVRFEDGRQRHPNDHAPELPAAAVRALIRSDPRVRLLVTHADRPFIEEVHFGSTPDEAGADLVGHLLDLGSARGSSADAARAPSAPRASCSAPGSRSGIPENAGAKLDLLDCSAADRAAIEGGNAGALRAR